MTMTYSTKQYLPSSKMKDLIIDNSLLLHAISRFDIAFGFGDATISSICIENCVDTDTFLAVCNLLSGNSCRYDSISLPSLIGYLRRAHTSFLDIAFPKIRHHLIEAINYSATNDAVLLLIRYFDDYVAEVKRHMDYENDVIFRYADSLLSGKPDNDFRISDFSGNHSHMATKLKELKDIFIYHYKQKENARLSATLSDIIICERDLMSHFEVENRLLIPAVERLEQRLEKRSSNPTAIPQNIKKEEIPDVVKSLSSREIDIIRCVAQGKANKEIADELCISAYTVATHRRNICQKLEIHSAAGLTIFAIIHHLVKLTDVHPH